MGGENKRSASSQKPELTIDTEGLDDIPEKDVEAPPSTCPSLVRKSDQQNQQAETMPSRPNQEKLAADYTEKR